MPNNNIKRLITNISEERNSNVICYIAGERQNVSTRIAPDIIPVFYKHLQEFNNDKKIDLFLYTKGGDVLTTLRLVHLIYEYTDKFSVLVPYKAYSAGTLICLGASEISMGKMSELGPVDPNVTSRFNPQDPNNQSAKIPINVEDVYSFISMAKNIVGIEGDESLSKILEHLVEHIHPLAIGSIYRTYSLIRSVATKLLYLHMDKEQSERVQDIVDNLTEKFFSHSYMISRREAKESIKLPIKYSSKKLEKVMWDLYEIYAHQLVLGKPFIPEESADVDGRFSVCSGIIESIHRKDGYVFDGIVQKTNIQDPNSVSNVNIIDQGWRKI